jgi:chromosome segregation ATPase
MDEVNYNDKVILPFLEKKCKDLLSMNMVMEAKLLVETQKYKDFEQFSNNYTDEIDNLKDTIEQKNLEINTLQSQMSHVHSEKNAVINRIETEKNAVINRIETERNNLSSQLNTLTEQLKRETSVKDSIHVEYNILKAKFDELNIQRNTLAQEIELLKSELEVAKATPVRKSTKKELAHGNN